MSAIGIGLVKQLVHFEGDLHKGVGRDSEAVFSTSRLNFEEKPGNTVYFASSAVGQMMDSVKSRDLRPQLHEQDGATKGRQEPAYNRSPA